MNGLKKGILYSLKPHELKLCGPRCVPDSQGILRRYVLGENIPERTVRKLLNEFHGASDYYRLIARTNDIKDFFDKKVVEAYWLGNRLLDRVSADAIKRMIMTDFVKPEFLTKNQAQKIIDKIPPDVAAHHSFHVFFVGSVTGRLKFNPALRDVCRTGWGEVLAVGQGKAKVKTLKFLPRKRAAAVTLEWDKNLTPKLKRGDLVSFHWGRVSERLTRGQFKNLIKYTLVNLKAYQEAYGK